MNDIERVHREILACKHCETLIPHAPRPVVQLATGAKILIAGQAPGRKVHETGVAFADASGDRLREWMGIDKCIFYNAKKIAILPMAFCYPGSGKSGDLPPRPECAELWREQVLRLLVDTKLLLCIGQYAHEYHLKNERKDTLTETVAAWKSYGNNIFPLPHPSPRNNIWLHRNPWFEKEVLPSMKARIKEVLND